MTILTETLRIVMSVRTQIGAHTHDNSECFCQNSNQQMRWVIPNHRKWMAMPVRFGLQRRCERSEAQVYNSKGELPCQHMSISPKMPASRLDGSSYSASPLS